MSDLGLQTPNQRELNRQLNEDAYRLPPHATGPENTPAQQLHRWPIERSLRGLNDFHRFTFNTTSGVHYSLHHDHPFDSRLLHHAGILRRWTRDPLRWFVHNCFSEYLGEVYGGIFLNALEDSFFNTHTTEVTRVELLAQVDRWNSSRYCDWRREGPEALRWR
jgi:hypothetical protein